MRQDNQSLRLSSPNHRHNILSMIGFSPFVSDDLMSWGGVVAPCGVMPERPSQSPTAVTHELWLQPFTAMTSSQPTPDALKVGCAHNHCRPLEEHCRQNQLNILVEARNQLPNHQLAQGAG